MTEQTQTPVWQKYGDSEKRADERTKEATRFFHVQDGEVEIRVTDRPKAHMPIPQGILEIGPGFGGVTRALRTAFPDTFIRAVDADPKVQAIPQRDEALNQFLALDVTQLSDQQLKEILGLNQDSEAQPKIDHLSALRTSSAVVQYLLETLPRIGYQGTFLFSLIDKTDDRHFGAIEKQLVKISLQGGTVQKFAFVESRAFNEIGQLVTFN